MNELNDAQILVRKIINDNTFYQCGLPLPVRPTSIELTSKEYDRLNNLSNPFNMSTIKWLEQTCNVIINKLPGVNKVEYTVDEILAKL